MNKVFFMTNQNVILLIEKCRDTREVDSHVILLREINASLPLLGRIEMPTLITDDYRRRVLEIIEDRISATLKNTAQNSLGHKRVTIEAYFFGFLVSASKINFSALCGSIFRSK
jgi:hypothetical protein